MAHYHKLLILISELILIDKVNQVFTYIFDIDIAYKMLTIEESEISKLTNEINDYLVVEFEEDSKSVFVSTKPYPSKTFKEGQTISVIDNNGVTYKAKITSVLSMNSYEAPIDNNNCFKVIVNL